MEVYNHSLYIYFFLFFFDFFLYVTFFLRFFLFFFCRFFRFARFSRYARLVLNWKCSNFGGEGGLRPLKIKPFDTPTTSRYFLLEIASTLLIYCLFPARNFRKKNRCKSRLVFQRKNKKLRSCLLVECLLALPSLFLPVPNILPRTVLISVLVPTEYISQLITHF